jgi:hypothetical protein
LRFYQYLYSLIFLESKTTKPVFPVNFSHDSSGFSPVDIGRALAGLSVSGRFLGGELVNWGYRPAGLRGDSLFLVLLSGNFFLL